MKRAAPAHFAPGPCCAELASLSEGGVCGVSRRRIVARTLLARGIRSQGHSQRLQIRCADSPRPPSLRSRCAHRLWQSVYPSIPPSHVLRPKVGDPMGAEPPWSSGRESRGDRLEIGPLWRFLSPVSFPLKETGSRRSAKSPRPVPVFRPRRSGQSSKSLRIRRSPLRLATLSRRLRRADFFAAKEIGKRNRQREPRRSARRSLRFRRTVILRKLRIARWLLLFKSKRFVSI